MKIQQIILKLFYTSSGWLLRFSFIALPIALFFSISSFLFIENLLNSYERYLVNTYLGSQGRISLKTSDRNLIDGLSKFSTKNNFLYSIKSSYKANVVFSSGEKKITKYAKFIILNKSYLNKKFNQNNSKDITLFVNQVFYKSMGSLNLKKFKKISFDDTKSNINIEKIIYIDTGFLGSEPTIFISEIFAKKLFGTMKHINQQIEYLELENDKINTIKEKIKSISKDYKVLEYQIYDLLQDTKEIKNFFAKINMIEFAISFLLFMLSLGVIILSVSISIKFKNNSLKILQLIGMSKRDLSITISGIVFIMIIFMLFISLLMMDIYRKIFLNISDFKVDFFIPLASINILYIVIVAFLIMIITFFSTKFIFGKSE